MTKNSLQECHENSHQNHVKKTLENYVKKTGFKIMSGKPPSTYAKNLSSKSCHKRVLWGKGDN